MSDVSAASRPYSVEVPFRWSDMDSYGHVNNVQFMRMLEDARVLGFGDWFGTERTMLQTGVLVAHHSVDYRLPMTFHYRPALVSMWVSRISGASFDLAYEVREAPDPSADTADETVFCVAETVLAAYDLATSRTRRLAPEEVEVLRRYEGEPAPLRRRGGA